MIYRAALLTFLLAARLTAATLPGGFYVMQPLRGNNPPLTDKVVSAPQLAGVHVRDKWQLFEATPGKYDFSFFDAQLARINKLGKQVIGGLYAGVATDPKANDIGSFTRAVAALGARYDGRVAAWHISAPQVTNESMEMYLPSSWKGGDAAAITLWKQSIDAFAKAFPSTPLVLDIAMAGKSGTITKAVDDYAWATLGASRISYIVCNLKASTNLQADHIKELMRMGGLGAHIGAEMVGPSVDRARFGGTFAQALAKGDQIGVEWLQIYQQDIKNIPATAALMSAASPEPATLTYLGIAICLFGFTRFRKNASHCSRQPRRGPVSNKEKPNDAILHQLDVRQGSNC